eukprot:PhF_6_TR17071/c0_g1_i2/m.26164
MQSSHHRQRGINSGGSIEHRSRGSGPERVGGPPRLKGLSGRGTFETGEDENEAFNTAFRTKFPKLSSKYVKVEPRYHQGQVQQSSSMGTPDDPSVLDSMLKNSSMVRRQRSAPKLQRENITAVLKQFEDEDRSFKKFLKFGGGGGPSPTHGVGSGVGGGGGGNSSNVSGSNSGSVMGMVKGMDILTLGGGGGGGNGVGSSTTTSGSGGNSVTFLLKTPNNGSLNPLGGGFTSPMFSPHVTGSSNNNNPNSNNNNINLSFGRNALNLPKSPLTRMPITPQNLQLNVAQLNAAMAPMYLVSDDDVLPSARGTHHRRASTSTSNNNTYSGFGGGGGYDNARFLKKSTTFGGSDAGYGNVSTPRDMKALLRKASMASILVANMRKKTLVKDMSSDDETLPTDTSNNNSSQPNVEMSSMDEDDWVEGGMMHDGAVVEDGGENGNDGEGDDDDEPKHTASEAQFLGLASMEDRGSRAARRRQRHVVHMAAHHDAIGEVNLDALSRNWNEDYQQLIELNCMTPFEASERARKISKLLAEFSAAVLPVANVIIQERDVRNKQIPTVAAGGRAGGDKYIVGNVFFKFCNNHYTEMLYGGFENSIKAATHERRGINAFVACNSKRLRVPLCMVVTYRGQRLWVSTLIPVDKGSLKYGSQDAGQTVVADDTAFALMRQVARALGIKGHYVGAKGDNLTLLFGPVDLEIHLAKDGRMYVIDTARLFPPDPNIPWRDNDKFYMYCQLRPELVAANDYPLSSDAWSPFGHFNREINDDEVRKTAKNLIDVVIVQATPKIVHKLFSPQKPWVPVPITSEMHRYGINMRYLGLVLETFITSCEKSRTNGTFSPIKQCSVTHLLSEILARTVKVLFLIAMKRIQSSEPNRAYYAATCDLFNNVFSGTTDSQSFYRREVLPRLIKKFNPGIRGRALCDTLWSKDALDPDIHPAVYTLAFQRVNELCGIVWNHQPSRDQSLLNRLGKASSASGSIFTVALLITLNPVVKYCEISPFANVLKLIAEGQLEEAERIYQTELSSREAILGDSPSLVPLLDSLATLYTHPYWNSTRSNELMQTRKRIVKIYQDRYSESDDLVNGYVSSLCSLGELNFSIHNYGESQSIFRTALNIAIDLLQPPSEVLGMAYHCYAKSLELYGHYTEAKKHFDNAIVACGNRPGVEPFIENVLQSRALLRFTLMNEKAAMEDSREALQSLRSRLPEDAPTVALCKINLALVCHKRNSAEALQLCEEAREVVLKEYGRKSFQNAYLLSTLSRATLHAGRFEEGYRYCEESLSMQQLLGASKIGIADTLLLLAKFFYFPFHELQLEGKEQIPMRLNSAKAYLLQAKDLYIELLKDSLHPVICRINTLLADIHRILRQYQDSYTLARDAVRGFEGHKLFYGRVADAMVVLGRSLCHTGKHNEAVQMYYHAMNVYEHSGVEAFLCVELLGVCLPHMRQKHTAPLLQPHDQKMKIDVMSRLIAFYLHHKQHGHVAMLIRQTVYEYRALFPLTQPWRPDAKPILSRFEIIAKQMPLMDDVSGDLTRFMEREAARCKDYVAQELHNAATAEKEAEALRLERLKNNLNSVLRQIKFYAAMGRAGSALKMFPYALDSFSQAWPRGALPNDTVSMEIHNGLIEQLNIVKTKLVDDQDIHLFQDTINCVRQYLGTDTELEESFRVQEMDKFEFLRSSSDHAPPPKSITLSPKHNNTPGALNNTGNSHNNLVSPIYNIQSPLQATTAGGGGSNHHLVAPPHSSTATTGGAGG